MSSATQSAAGVRSVAQRLSVRAAPPDVAREIGSRMFRRHDMTVLERGASPTLSARAMVRPNLTIGVLSYSAPVRVDSEIVEDCYQVNIPLRGTFRSTSGDVRSIIGVGEAGLYGSRAHGRGRAGIEGWDFPSQLLGVKFGRARMHELASEMTGRTVDALDLPASIDLRCGKGREWLSLLQVLTNPLMVRSPSLADAPWAGDLLESPIMCGLLDLAGVGPAAETDEARAATRTGDVRAVIGYIDRYPARVHSVPELAAVGGMSVRTLQAAFQERFGMSPSRYMRGLRLDGARADLLAADPGTTVAETARRWGFGNTGRFAAAYVDRFDELPKDTLRIARR